MRNIRIAQLLSEVMEETLGTVGNVVMEIVRLIGQIHMATMEVVTAILLVQPQAVR